MAIWKKITKNGKLLKIEFSLIQLGRPIAHQPREDIMKRADSVMTERQLYLNPRLRQQDLAAAIGTNRTYLSEAMRECGIGFREYVNSYRVKHFIHLANSPSTIKKTTVELAERSGFITVQPLNDYFRKSFGISASKYLKQVDGCGEE